MKTIVLNVPGISCEHCERTITGALEGVPGITSLRVDIPQKQVILEAGRDGLDLERVKYWLSKGAQPSDTVASFIKKASKPATALVPA